MERTQGELGTRIEVLAIRINSISNRLAVRKRRSLIAAGQASASTQIRSWLDCCLEIVGVSMCREVICNYVIPKKFDRTTLFKFSLVWPAAGESVSICRAGLVHPSVSPIALSLKKLNQYARYIQ